jgi:hypothetical protein
MGYGYGYSYGYEWVGGGDWLIRWLYLNWVDWLGGCELLLFSLTAMDGVESTWGWKDKYDMGSDEGEMRPTATEGKKK